MQHELPGSMGNQHEPFAAARAASEQDLEDTYSPQGDGPLTISSAVHCSALRVARPCMT